MSSLHLSLLGDVLSSNWPLTDIEKARLNTFIAESEHQLETLSKDISDLKSQLRILCDKEAALLQGVAACKGALSKFRELPDDVVGRIFEECIDTTRNPTMSNTEAPVLLTQISSWMRHIALNTPTIWSSIHIPIIARVPMENVEENKLRMAERAAGVKEWLHQRSGALPLSISVYELTYDNYESYSYGDPSVDDMGHEIMGLIVGCSSRWKDVSFHCSPASLLGAASLMRSNVPLLQSISLKFHFARLAEYLLAWNGSQVLRTSSLEKLSLSGAVDDLANYKVNWTNLTHLTYRPIGDTQVDTLAITRILRQGSGLISLDISLKERFDVVSVSSAFGKISLPSLKILLVGESLRGHTKTILSSIYAPLLESITLRKHTDLDGLLALLERSPNIRQLSLHSHSVTAANLRQWLGHCPSLTNLHVREIYDPPIGNDDEYDYDEEHRVKVETEVTKLMKAFVHANPNQQLCPKMQYFQCDEPLRLSADTVYEMIMRKKGTIVGLDNWKGIKMSIRYNATDYDDYDMLSSEDVTTGLELELSYEEFNGVSYSLYEGLSDEDEDYS